MDHLTFIDSIFSSPKPLPSLTLREPVHKGSWIPLCSSRWEKRLQTIQTGVCIGLFTPKKVEMWWGRDTKRLLFTGCLEASCHIELSIYLYLETLEILQEGLGESLNCQPARESQMNKSCEEFLSSPTPSPPHNRGVYLSTLCALWQSRYTSLFSEEILFIYCQSNLCSTPWRVPGSWRAAAFVRTYVLTLEPTGWNYTALTESCAHGNRKPIKRQGCSNLTITVQLNSSMYLTCVVERMWTQESSKLNLQPGSCSHLSEFSFLLL